MSINCAVITCKATSKNTDAKFYRFPHTVSRFKYWAKAAGRPDLMEMPVEDVHRTFFMCDQHFHLSEQLKTMKLKYYAAPTLNLAPLENKNPSKSVQADDKTKLSEDVDYPNTENPDCSVQFVQLTKLQNQLKKIDTYEMLELFALIPYLAVPKTYGVLHQFLELPAPRKLQKMNIGIDTKLNTNTTKCLETKVKNMKKYEKQCIVCAVKVNLATQLFYEITKDRIVGFNDINGVQTTEPATHAVVLVARGIYSDWEQPLNYCFLSKGNHCEELRAWLDETLTKVMKIGLNVTAFISGQEKIFTDIARILHVSEENPFYLVNEKKIYFLYDFRDLMTSLQHNLIKYNFLFQDTDGQQLLASWEDLRTLYAEDSKRQYRLAPELTAAHINTTESDKIKPEYFSQVFNETVVAAMTASKDLKQLREDSIGTIKFIELVKDTLNTLNTTLILSELTATAILMEFLQFLYNVTVQETNTKKDVTKSVTCLERFRISVKSIIDLSNDLRSKGFTSCPLNKINRNTAHKFIDLIKGKNLKRPTPIEFIRAYRSYFMKKLTEKSKEIRSTDTIEQLLSMDVNNILASLKPRIARTLPVATTDYRINLPEDLALVYASGYFMQKCFNIHKCSNMLRYLCDSSECKNYPIYLKAFAKFEHVPIPPETFIHLIDKLDNIFIRCLQNKIIGFIANDIMKAMEHVTFDLCCHSFPMEYLKKLFIRFRLFNVIRTNNRNFRDPSFQWKCFCVYDM